MTLASSAPFSAAVPGGSGDGSPLSPSPKKTIQIFVSHKAREGDRQAAINIKEWLKKIDGVDAFVSSDYRSLAGGDEFLTKIQQALDEASLFFLLYTDPEEVWDWCLYECGYFAGKHQSTRKFTALHPSSSLPPGPIRAKVQTIGTDAKLIEATLERVLQDVHPSKPIPCSGNLTLPQIAKNIAREVRAVGLDRTKFNTGLEVLTPPGRRDLARLGQIPRGTRVTFLGDAGQIFGKKRARVSWSRFARLAEEAHFEVESLVDLLRMIANEDAFRPMLPLLVSKEERTRAYRPVVTSYDLMRNGSIKVRMMLVYVQAPFDLNSEEPIEIISHLLAMAKQFHSHVVKEIQPTFEAMRGDPAVVARRELDELARLKRLIKRALFQSSHRRLSDAGRVKAAFLPQDGPILDLVRERWEEAFAMLGNLCARAAGTVRDDAGIPLPAPQRQELHACFDLIRHVNRDILHLAADRFAVLVRETVL